MRVLIAPDSFKGSLGSVVVARALADGWERARPADQIRMLPLADGGEGTLDALVAAGGWQLLPAAATDPLGRPIAARFLRNESGSGRAVVELAEASGLSRLTPAERDPLAASTFGTGQVLAAAIGLGCHEILLGVGGSATTDGGSGLLTALGARLLDAAGAEIPPGGGGLERLATIDLEGLPPELATVRLTVASDVTNPLLGDDGAAATYGPQKGASPDQVARLERALARYADLLEASSGRSVRDVPGAGAAGGTTAALLAIADRFERVDVRPGVTEVMRLAGFDDALGAADLVLTGEGRIDAQTRFGKTVQGVARRAQAAGIPCLCFGGAVTSDGTAVLTAVGAIGIPVSEGPTTVAAALGAGPGPLERAAERTARLVGLATR